MAKNILRRQFSNMYGKNKPFQNPEPLPTVKDKLPAIEPPNVTVTMIIVYTLLVVFILFIYLNRNAIYTALEKWYSQFKPGNQLDELEEKYHRLFQSYSDASMNQQKLDEVLEQGRQRMDSIESREQRLIELLEKNQSCHSLEMKEKEHKENEKKEEKGGVNQLREKIAGYTKEQTVTSNGFCYIGFDNNQRECTNVSDGDICMSGQVFPTLDVCLYPKFRH